MPAFCFSDSNLPAPVWGARLRRSAAVACLALGMALAPAAQAQLAPGHVIAPAPNVTVEDIKPAPEDWSVKFIRAVTGDSEKVTDENPMIGGAFAKYNAAALICIAALFIFVTTLGILKTAQDGRALGNWSNVMVPFRFILALTLLFPTTSGFSLAQLLMLWLVSLSAGMANYVWKAGVDGYTQVAEINSLGLAHTGTEMGPILRTILEAEACKTVINERTGGETIKRLDFPRGDGGKVWFWGTEKQMQAAASSPWYETAHPLEDGRWSDYEGHSQASGIYKGSTHAECGMVLIKEKSRSLGAATLNWQHRYDRDRASQSWPGRDWWGPITAAVVASMQSLGDSMDLTERGEDMTRLNKQLLAARIAGIEGALAVAENVKYLISNPTQTAADTNSPTQAASNIQNTQSMQQLMENMALAYHSRVQARLAEVTGPAGLGALIEKLNTGVGKAMREKAVDQGWMTAGTFLTSQARTLHAVKGVTISPLSYERPGINVQTDKNVADYRADDARRLNALIQTAAQEKASLGETFGAEMVNPNKEQSVAASGAVWMGELLSYDPSKMTSPVAQVANVGQAMAEAVGAVYAGPAADKLFGWIPGVGWAKRMVTGAANLAAGAVNKAAGFLGHASASSNNPAESAIEKLATTYTVLAPVLYAIGIGLAVVLPLLPAGLWLAGIFSWALSVIAALVAAPVWTAAHAFPEGSDTAGKGGPGYMLLIEVLFRPVLMIFGLLFATTLCVPLFYMLSMLLKDGLTVTSVYTPATTMGAIIAGMICYVVGSWILLFQTFSMVNKLPRMVMSYIGGHSSADSDDNTYLNMAYLARGSLTGNAVTALHKRKALLDEMKNKKPEEQGA